MNRRKLVIPVGLLFFILLIYTSSGFNESKFLFVLRHLLVFSLVVYIVVEGQLLIRDYLLDRFDYYKEKQSLIKIGTGVMGAIVLLIMSTLQISYITENELISNIECQLYGPKNYLIYISDTKYCPEIVTEPIPSDNQTRTIAYENVNLGYQDSEIPSSFHLSIEYGPNGEIKERTQYIRIYEGNDSYSFLKITEKSILTTELITITQEYSIPEMSDSVYLEMEDIIDIDYDEPFKTVVYQIEIKQEGNGTLVTTSSTVTENGETTSYIISEGTFDDRHYTYNLFSDDRILNTSITHFRSVNNFYYLHSIEIFTNGEKSGLFDFGGMFNEYMKWYKEYSPEDETKFKEMRSKSSGLNEKQVTGGYYTYRINTDYYMHRIERLGPNSYNEINLERSDDYLLTYDYEQQINDLDRYDEYYLYSKNPLVEYVYIVLGGDFIE